MEGFEVLGADDSGVFDYKNFMRTVVGEEAPKEKSTGEKAWEGIKDIVPSVVSAAEKLAKGGKTPDKPADGSKTAAAGGFFSSTAGMAVIAAGVLGAGFFLVKKFWK